ncbi:MAG: hypothetical protein ACRC0V_07775 [Fusobacteriaceae bacterium]|uniref:hypothetical protein n=1 Tax=Romboutsia sp. TaxID=1965302 RepID=UPI003F39914A
MSYLFEIEEKRVYPKAEILLVNPFKEIWDRDKSKNKETAIKELSYAEFMTSMLRSNPFREYAEDRKEVEIKQVLNIPKDWKGDSKLQLVIDKLEEIQTEGSVTYRYWKSNKTVIEKLIEFFNNIDVNERNPKTSAPIYKPADITKAITDSEKVLISITTAKKKVEEELFETTRNRSDKKIGYFANPESIINT